MIVHEHPRDFESGVCDGCHISTDQPMGLSLNSHHGTGSFTSADLTLPQPASEVVLSINLVRATAASTGVQGLVQAQVDGAWSPWYQMVTWGKTGEALGTVTSTQGQVYTDVLKLTSPSSVWRYRIAWSTHGESPVIHRLALSHAVPQASQDTSTRAAWGTHLDVPYLSQWTVKQHPPERVCSPTSVAIVVSFYGCSLTADEVAAQTYDPVHDIYGNWALNMLAISRMGFRATVEHGGAMTLLEDSVTAGHPLVASIAYAKDALPGAPKPASDGHLVVVSGFTKTGDVITRDPAARTDNAWHTYPREAFARAWLNHGGVVYRMVPEGA